MNETEDATTTRLTWWVAIATALLLFAIIALLSWFDHWHWVSNLWFNYAWSSDKGNGPEAIQQTIVYAVAATLLIPPIRHAMERFAERHVAALKAHMTAEADVVHNHLHHVSSALNIEHFDHRKDRP